MLLSTPGLVLHTTPYSEASVVAKVFTRQLGVRSYLVKGVRGPRGKVKQNLLQPLSCVDMVVYDNPKSDLNYIKEIVPRHTALQGTDGLDNQVIANALRFFMTEVMYKALREEEPMPDLFDYVEETTSHFALHTSHLPILFLLTVARYLGIEPLDNATPREPFFDLQEGRYVSAPTETTLPMALSAFLHDYLCSNYLLSSYNSGKSRRDLLDALLAYYQLHLSGFRSFRSHEILHTILK